MKFAPPKDDPTASAGPRAEAAALTPIAALDAAAQSERLSAHEAGELDDAASRDVRAWLEHAHEGRRARQRLRRLRQVTAALPVPALPADHRRALGDRIEAAVRARLRRRRLLAAAVGTAALAAAATVVLLIGRHATEPRTTAFAPGRAAHAGLHLRTGPGDFQLLPIGDRAVAFVGEDTDVEAHPGLVPALRLLRGSVRLMVRRRVDDPFVVSTPAADVAVLGTEFDVSVAQGETEVKVVRGEVEVRNPQGRRRLWARDTARARPGEPPRLWLPVRGLVSEGAPRVEARPAR